MRGVFAVLAVTAAPLTATPAQADACPVELAHAVSGPAAITALGEDLGAVAADADMSPQRLRRTLRTDKTLHVDTCGRLFYADPKPSVRPESQQPAALSPGADVFALHSRPSSNRTLYLDFTGHQITDSAWSDDFGDFTAPAYSMDDDPAFNATEQARIASIWQRVAEDYAPFNVDVTTEEPDPAAITRSSAADLVYGTRVAIVNDTNPIYEDCECGGIAYLGAFDLYLSHSYYQPAFVFVAGVGTSPKTVAEAASHEAGHNFALQHDGTSLVEYYKGHNVWAPIMGNGYSRPVTQWSKGEYTGANRTEDDLTIIAANGAPVLADDVGDTRATATDVVGEEASGLISTRADVDWFRFAARSSTSVTVDPAPVSPNLDVAVSLYDADGLLLASSDPASVFDTSDLAGGLNASVTRILSAGTYYAKVDGVGARSAATDGYSDYGSLGRYDLTISTNGAPLGFRAFTPPIGMVHRPFSSAFSATGGDPPYTFGLATGSLPPGLVLNADGSITGTPTTAGTYFFTVAVSDGASGTASRAASIHVSPALTLDPQTPGPATVGEPYAVTFGAGGGNPPHDFFISAGDLPTGLSLDSDGTLSGVPEEAGVYAFTLAVEDADGFRSTRDFVIEVSGVTSVDRLTLPDATAAWPYTVQITSSGGPPPYTYALQSGALPAGLTLTPDGRVTGTPASVGTFTFSASATDSSRRRTDGEYTVTVRPALRLTGTDPADSVVGRPYRHSFAATGGTAPYTFGLSGTAPVGLSLSAAGVLSGTPGMAGRGSFTVTVTDANGVVTQGDASMAVNPASGIAIQTTKLPAAKVKKRYSARLRASAPGTWQLTAGRVPGLRLSSTGILRGKPRKAGRYRLTVRVTADGGLTASRQVKLKVKR